MNKSIQNFVSNTQPSNFLYQIGDNNFDFNNIRLFENKGNEVENDNSNDSDLNIKNFLPICKAKTLCWICYKIILLDNCLTYSHSTYTDNHNRNNNKQYCSQVCLDKYIQETIVNILYK